MMFKGDMSFWLVQRQRNSNKGESDPGRVTNSDQLSLWEHYPSKLDLMFSISLGYGIYDTITMLFQRSTEPSMWIHHFFMIAGCIASMWYKQSAILSTSILFTEITVLPTNIQWYLRMFGFRGTNRYKIVSLLKLIFFIYFRVGAGPYIMYRLAQEGHMPSFRQLSSSAQVLSLSLLTIFSLLNILWTVKVARNTVRTFTRR